VTLDNTRAKGVPNMATTPKATPMPNTTPDVDTSQYGEWEDVLARPDHYIAWHAVGQRVFGSIVKIGEGSDYNDNPCPEWFVKLAEVTTTELDDKEVTCEIESIVAVTGGQASLKSAMEQAKANEGDLTVITFTSTYPTEHKQEGKAFTIKLARVKRSEGESF
jgi:hypothetical protein